MHIAIDIVLLLLFVFTTIRYYKAGFVKALFSICKFLLSVVIAFSFASTLGSFISDNVIYEPIYKEVHENLETIANNSAENFNMTDVLNTLPASLRELIISETDFESLDDENVTESNIQKLSENISLRISKIVSNIIAFICIFIIAMLALKIAMNALDAICTLPVLKQINKFLGLLLGFVFGFFQAILACSLISAILNIICVSYPNYSLEVMNEKTLIFSFINSLDIWQLF